MAHESFSRPRKPLARSAATLLLLLVLAHTNSAAAVAAPASQADPPPYGILVMAHGGTTEWNRNIDNAIDSAGSEVPLRVAFGMANRASLEEAIHALEAEGVRRIAVVRLFVSGDSFLPQTEYLLGLNAHVPDMLFDSSRVQGMRPVPDPAAVPQIEHGSEVVIFGKGLVDAALSGRILAERALHLSTDPARESVLVIAHGLGDEAENNRLIEALRQQAASIERASSFRDVEVVALREDWPDERALAEKRIRDYVRRGSEDGEVIVLPFRVSGFGPYAEVLDGLEYRADGTGLLPHEAVGSWVIESARTVACGRAWAPCDD